LPRLWAFTRSATPPCSPITRPPGARSPRSATCSRYPRKTKRRRETMNLHELSPAAGSNTKAYRKGRGNGSGNGKTAGRGQKGQWARSGGGVRVGFEGGQMPLARRLPKRGFHNIFAKPLEAVNVSTLDAKFADGEVVTAQALLEKGILSKCQYGVKILGNGSISKKLTVHASAFSA